jgi:hypothetical protein
LHSFKEHFSVLLTLVGKPTAQIWPGALYYSKGYIKDFFILIVILINVGETSCIKTREFWWCVRV